MIFEKNKSLKTLNTFGFDQSAEYYCEPSSPDDLLEALEFSRQKELPIFVLGGGSNIVLTKDLPGLTIRQQTHQITYERGEGYTAVSCDAGVNWHQLVLATIENGLYGLENLSLIPGDVGAAPIQNIGAYGVEICEHLTHVTALNIESGQFEKIDGTTCQFGYRDSIFKGQHRDQFIITEVHLKLADVRQVNISYRALADELARRDFVEPSAKEISDVVCAIRQSKLPDPAVIGNAGSFFKNPVVTSQHYNSLKKQNPDMPGYPQEDRNYKVPAAWLIEQTGWKGRQVNGVGVHSLQALVLVHLGGASGNQLLELASAVRESVKRLYDIELEQEPVAL